MNISTVSRDKWLEARLELLDQEKELTRLRDKVSETRRKLPRVKIEQDYVFTTNQGEKSLADLFGSKSQLIIYHFMYGNDWEEGCKSCSFWADNFEGIDVHLANRDVSFIAMSRAELKTLNTFKKRMGWSFEWVSSLRSDFNRDFDVSFDPADFENETATYNYRPFTYPMNEHAGVSVFQKDTDGSVYHTYSTYSRGLDILNGAYHYLDLVPKGRDETQFEYGMEWLKHHDKYSD